MRVCLDVDGAITLTEDVLSVRGRRRLTFQPLLVHRLTHEVYARTCVKCKVFLTMATSAHLKKKGENLAIHEDIDKLVTQVSAVKQTTEEIKAEISNDVWRRQKHWELKKEVLFEATRKLRALEEVLVSLQTLYQVKEKYDSEKFIERTKEEFVHWRKASEEFKEAALLVGIVCGKELSSGRHVHCDRPRRRI